MKDIGAAKKVLRMENYKDQKASKFYLSQRKHIEKYLIGLI